MRLRHALALVALALGGCAKFPANGASNNFAHVVFNVTMSQSINPSFIYIIAIRPIFSTDTNTDTNGPIPVVLNGSLNGFVEGWPTRFIQYDEANVDLYTVNRFPARTPTTENPIPVNLAAWNPYGAIVPNTGVDPRPSANGGIYGRNIGFDLDTRYLADSDDQARTIVAIQFNILTMNKTALNSISDRVMDALGDSRSQGTVSFNNYEQRSLLTSGHYTNTTATVHEGDSDTYNGTLPSIDIVDWTLDVRTP